METLTPAHTQQPTPVDVDTDHVRKLLNRRSFATLATTSDQGWPHSAGILYDVVGDSIYINTVRTSRKARNIAANSRVSMCVPVRRLPIGPPSSIHFQARAELLELDDPEITSLIADGHLKSLTSHGELEIPNGCFVRITPRQRVLTYGLGMPIRQLIKDPLSASGSADYSVGRTG